MARINIEEELYGDHRFRRLTRKVGNEDNALGLLVRFWRLAQKYWGDNESLVPLSEFEAEDFQVISEAGLAEVRESGVYAKGAKKHFAWYLQRVDAGKKRADAPRTESGQFTSDSPAERKPAGQNTSETQLPDQRNPVSHQPLSLALALSPALAQKKEEYSVGKPDAKALVPKTGPPGELNTRKFIATYVKAYQARYSEKSRPEITGKVQGQIKNFLKSYPIDRACELVQVYCQMEERWFLTKHHDLGTFLENLNKVSYALDTGLDANQTDWSRVFEDRSL